MKILQQHFSLETEAMADALHHSCHFTSWFSAYEIDKAFGAEHDFFRQNINGRNIYICPIYPMNFVEKVVQKIAFDFKQTHRREQFY